MSYTRNILFPQNLVQVEAFSVFLVASFGPLLFGYSAGTKGTELSSGEWEEHSGLDLIPCVHKRILIHAVGQKPAKCNCLLLKIWARVAPYSGFWNPRAVNPTPQITPPLDWARNSR